MPERSRCRASCVPGACFGRCCAKERAARTLGRKGALYDESEGAVRTRVHLTPAQRKALDNYNYALRQEDRYLGSVFVTPRGQAEIETKTRIAYEACKALGMTHEHGL